MFTKEDFAKLKSMADVDKLSPQDFEWFCKFFLEHIGYTQILVTQKYGDRHADGGVDIICSLEGKKVYVQCKKWHFGFNGYMKIAPVRELGGCMLRDKISQGIFIGTLGYDQGTLKEAEKMNIRLIDATYIADQMRLLNPKFYIVKKRSFIRSLFQVLVRMIRFIFGT